MNAPNQSNPSTQESAEYNTKKGCLMFIIVILVCVALTALAIVLLGSQGTPPTPH